MIVEGTAYWASIRQPNTTFEPMYTINLVVDDEIAKDFASRGHSIREMEEGPAIVIKRKVNGPNGMTRKAPRLLDNDKNDVDVLIGNGSTVAVTLSVYDTRRKSIVGTRLDRVKVLEHVLPPSNDDDEVVSMPPPQKLKVVQGEEEVPF